MEPEPRLYPPEKPGWTAIVLIAAFVLAAVALYLAGARLVKGATHFSGASPSHGVMSSAGGPRPPFAPGKKQFQLAAFFRVD